MQIYGPSSIQGTRSISENIRTNSIQQTNQSPSIDTVDQLDISSEAQSILASHAAADIRTDRVAEIRAQIAAGKYESLEKISVAVDRLIDRLA